MKKILEGPSRRAGTIFQQIDTNFIEVCNSILRIAFPELTLKGFAETEPTEPALFDAYLVRDDASTWSELAEKNDIIFWDGIAWLILPYKITEINEAIQFNYFDADKISLTTIPGLDAGNVQQAIEIIISALVAAEIPIPEYSSGSTSI